MMAEKRKWIVEEEEVEEEEEVKEEEERRSERLDTDGQLLS